MENMKYFGAEANLPFGVKKGDILTYKEGNLYKGTTLLLYDPLKEKEYFKEVNKSNFQIGAECYIKKAIGKLPSYTKLKVVNIIDEFSIDKSNYVVVKHGNFTEKIQEKNLLVYMVYYFINSSGELHSALIGQNEIADDFRKKSNNYFDVKEDAITRLNEIMSIKL